MLRIGHPTSDLPIAIELEHLAPGDILLYRTSKDTGPVQYFIMFMQLFFSEKGGHFDTTHSSICIENGDNGPIIAHIGPDGYKREKLLNYDTEERAFLVFRLYSKDARDELAKVAASDQHIGLLWKFLSALRPMVRTARLDPKRELQEKIKTIDKRTYCTEFVVKSMKISAQQNDGYAYPHIRSSCSPKSLEAYLHANAEYQMFVHLGKNGYQKILNELEQSVIQINHPNVTKMYTNLNNEIINSTVKINDFYKLLLMLKVMQPILDLFSSAGDVMSLARKLGIFARDIQSFPVKEVREYLRVNK